jgi:hypothetical protein
MALNVTSVGDNPQQPFIGAETYIPDQLIAGNLKLVSDTVTVSGAATLARGSVMGMTKFDAGTAVASTGKAFATGTIVVAALPAAGDTLTVNGTQLTFAVAPGPFEDVSPPASAIPIQTTTALQAAYLCNWLNASTDANISKMTYTVSSSTITCTSIAIGTAGNAYTLATSDSSAFTVPANLSGGTANTGTSTVGSISLGPQAAAGNYTITATATSQTSAFTITNPRSESMPNGAVGTAYTSQEINFTITAGGTVTAGDTFIITVPPTALAPVWKLCTAAAVDGSEVPAGILADYCDPTGGNVTAGVYLMGEFNANALIYDPALSLAFIKAAFSGRGVFVKTTVSADDPM